jgi:predicted Rossmann fold nucleotide-binding protein DprA/Smf involved in DNA uptake
MSARRAAEREVVGIARRLIAYDDRCIVEGNIDTEGDAYKDQLRAALKKLDKQERDRPAPRAPRDGKCSTCGHEPRPTLRRDVLALLVSESLGPKAIARRTGQTEHAVSQMLHVMQRDGAVVRVGHGQWRSA